MKMDINGENIINKILIENNDINDNNNINENNF